MKNPLTRRTFLGTIAAGSVVSIAGCSNPEQETIEPIRGTVTDLDGSSIPGATVETVAEAGRVVSQTQSDESGVFELPASQSHWLRIRHSDYLPRMRAVTPGSEYQIRLTPDTDTMVSLGFGGDVMFGRRFYTVGDNSLSEQAHIDRRDRAGGHRRILQHVRPFLEHTDIMSVNLETPLTTTDWQYPGKTFQFTSHPVAANALANAGVDYTALGNNHVFDALTPGLEDTTSALRNANVGYSGAGESSEQAWQPAMFERGKLNIAYVSCTTVVGGQYDIDWSADRTEGETYTVRQNGNTLTIPGGAGVAEASTEKLRTEVRQARDHADIVVVQIHGGEEYQRRPTETLRELTNVAIESGADLVVNHHPHVTGGLEYRDGALIAWSLGNLVFDQVLWETLRSYVLVAHVDRTGVQRVLAEPILLDGYTPKAVAGNVREKMVGDTAALSTGTLELGTAGINGLVGSTIQSTAQTSNIEANGQIYERNGNGITTITESEGIVQFGRDRVYTGGFEEILVDDGEYRAPLWRFRRRASSTGESVGYEGGGVKLTSFVENTRRSVLTPASRVPIEGNTYTIAGWYQSSSQADVEVLISWYNAASGPSFEQDIIELSGTGDAWQQFRRRVSPPEEATFINLFAYLSPPDEQRSHEVAFDDLRLIEWLPPEETSGWFSDYLYADGSAAIRTESLNSTAGISWTEF